MPLNTKNKYILVRLFTGPAAAPGYSSHPTVEDALKRARGMLKSRGCVPLLIVDQDGTIHGTKSDILAWASKNPGR
ncbi:MAG TPA: hypothetical protein VGE45_01035 [Chloroflexia bacterium]|jgi:hypothetical protein